jgi:hypothetical protein
MQKVTLRKSRVLEKLRAGKIASCFKTNLADYRTVQIAAMAPFKGTRKIMCLNRI